MGALSEVEGRMDVEQYVAILEGGLLQSMEDSGIPADDVIFQQDNDSKHISRRPKSGLRSRISSFWIGLLNLQTLTPLNTLGVIPKNVFQNIKGLPQGFINYGIEWWLSGGRFLWRSVRNG